MKQAQLLILFLIFFAANLYAGGNDTSSAVVLYGDEFLFDKVEDLDREEVQAYRDSLYASGAGSQELIDQIDLYLQIPDMSEQRIYQVIDSLFQSEHLPYPLINQINRFVANRTHTAQDLRDTFPHPAHNIYGSWNTAIPHPYPAERLAAQDSVSKIRLCGTPQLQKYHHPFSGPVTSKYGYRHEFGRTHKGVDIDLQVWDTVKSAFPGMVRLSRYYSGYGRVVVVRHFNGLETLYAHLHRFEVEPGDLVDAGDPIGLGGSSGNSTGSHLHWEIRYKGFPLDPHTFIDFEHETLKNDTLVLKKIPRGFASFPEGAVFHEVEKGEFLYKIANRYGTNVQTLCELNGIRRNKTLRVGEKLRVI